LGTSRLRRRFDYDKQRQRIQQNKGTAQRITGAAEFNASAYQRSNINSNEQEETLFSRAKGARGIPKSQQPYEDQTNKKVTKLIPNASYRQGMTGTNKSPA
jgi:hypothetical protein